MGWDWDESEITEAGLDVDWMETDEIPGREEGMLTGTLGTMEEMATVDPTDWEGGRTGGRTLLAGNILPDWPVWTEESPFSSCEMSIPWEADTKSEFVVESLDDWFKMFKRVWQVALFCKDGLVRIRLMTLWRLAIWMSVLAVEFCRKLLSIPSRWSGFSIPGTSSWFACALPWTREASWDNRALVWWQLGVDTSGGKTPDNTDLSPDDDSGPGLTLLTSTVESWVCMELVATEGDTVTGKAGDKRWRMEWKPFCFLISVFKGGNVPTRKNIAMCNIFYNQSNYYNV